MPRSVDDTQKPTEKESKESQTQTEDTDWDREETESGRLRSYSADDEGSSFSHPGSSHVKVLPSYETSSATTEEVPQRSVVGTQEDRKDLELAGLQIDQDESETEIDCEEYDYDQRFESAFCAEDDPHRLSKKVQLKPNVDSDGAEEPKPRRWSRDKGSRRPRSASGGGGKFSAKPATSTKTGSKSEKEKKGGGKKKDGAAEDELRALQCTCSDQGSSTPLRNKSGESVTFKDLEAGEEGDAIKVSTSTSVSSGASGSRTPPKKKERPSSAKEKRKEKEAEKKQKEEEEEEEELKPACCRVRPGRSGVKKADDEKDTLPACCRSNKSKSTQTQPAPSKEVQTSKGPCLKTKSETGVSKDEPKEAVPAVKSEAKAGGKKGPATEKGSPEKKEIFWTRHACSDKTCPRKRSRAMQKDDEEEELYCSEDICPNIATDTCPNVSKHDLEVKKKQSDASRRPSDTTLEKSPSESSTSSKKKKGSGCFGKKKSSKQSIDSSSDSSTSSKKKKGSGCFGKKKKPSVKKSSSQTSTSSTSSTKKKDSKKKSSKSELSVKEGQSDGATAVKKDGELVVYCGDRGKVGGKGSGLSKKRDSRTRVSKPKDEESSGILDWLCCGCMKNLFKPDKKKNTDEVKKQP